MSGVNPVTPGGEHRLMVNLLRCGLSRHVADQVIAEVEDSLWLAERDVRILKEATPEDVPHIVARVLRDAADEVGAWVEAHNAARALRSRADRLDPEAPR